MQDIRGATAALATCSLVVQGAALGCLPLQGSPPRGKGAGARSPAHFSYLCIAQASDRGMLPCCTHALVLTHVPLTSKLHGTWLCGLPTHRQLLRVCSRWHASARLSDQDQYDGPLTLTPCTLALLCVCLPAGPVATWWAALLAAPHNTMHLSSESRWVRVGGMQSWEMGVWSAATCMQNDVWIWQAITPGTHTQGLSDASLMPPLQHPSAAHATC
jgi:hypothetical protein